MKRPRFTGEAGVNQAVLDLLERFQYPTELPAAPSFDFGGGGGAPTIVIAASDSSEFSKAVARLVCNGIDDHVLIQQALDEMDTGTGLGGRVLLCEGTFNCEFGQIRTSDVTAQSPVHIQGVGRATILSFDGGSGVGIEVNSQNCTISDLTIHCNDTTGINAISVDDPGCTISNVFITNLGTGGAGISLEDQAAECVITGCEIAQNSSPGIVGNTGTGPVFITNNTIDFGTAGIQGTGTAWIITGNYISGSGWAVENQGDPQWIITGNKLISTDGLSFSTAADHCLVEANLFLTSGQVLFSAAVDGCKVSDNLWTQAQSPSVDGVIVFAAGATDCEISNNLIHDPGGLNGIVVTSGLDVAITGNLIGEAPDVGIRVTNSSRMLVTDNIVKWAGEHGIWIEGSSHCTLEGNQVFGSSQNTNNTWDNIHISGTSNRNLVQGNKVIPSTNNPPQTRYGVNVAGGECNMVVGNDLGDPDDYGSDALSDSGANTQLVYPADATYGDNFTDCGTGS